MAIELNSLEEALSRALELSNNATKRLIIGIVGKPGAGKSTLSSYLMEHLPREITALVPMDGYHLSNLQLANLGRSNRKGAPDTFDVFGFTELIKRIKTDLDNDIYFPIFHREIEESIAAEGVVHSNTKIVLTEGNYLLHSGDGWGNIASLLNECWFVEVDDELRLERLVNRHIAYGKEPKFAHDWAHGTDERNAELVAKSKDKASVIVNL